MIDAHTHPEAWGVRPVLFRVFGVEVPAYTFFVLLGLAVGGAIFVLQARRSRKGMGEHTVWVFLGAIIGGTLGAKLPYFIMHARLIVESWPDLTFLFAGRTIVGGLVGGAIGVFAVKRWFPVRGRRGDLFVPAIAVGVAIGRLGCFFRGCCYGKPTCLPWGVDFGDGVLRHPTQLYESVFLLFLLATLSAFRVGKGTPGKLFRVFMISYFGFRFVIEFLRVEPHVFLGLTAFQLVSLAVVVYYGWQLSRPPFREGLVHEPR